MSYRALYIVANRVIGQSTILAHIQPRCLAYFCQTCGEIWGRVAVSGEDSPLWETVIVPCDRHLPSGVVDWGTVPGSFILGKGNYLQRDLRVTAWGRAIEHLPDAVLTREFDLTMKHFERMENDSQD